MSRSPQAALSSIPLLSNRLRLQIDLLRHPDRAVPKLARGLHLEARCLGAVSVGREGGALGGRGAVEVVRLGSGRRLGGAAARVAPREDGGEAGDQGLDGADLERAGERGQADGAETEADFDDHAVYAGSGEDWCGEGRNLS